MPISHKYLIVQNFLMNEFLSIIRVNKDPENIFVNENKKIESPFHGKNSWMKQIMLTFSNQNNSKNDRRPEKELKCKL